MSNTTDAISRETAARIADRIAPTPWRLERRLRLIRDGGGGLVAAFPYGPGGDLNAYVVLGAMADPATMDRQATAVLPQRGRCHIRTRYMPANELCGRLRVDVWTGGAAFQDESPALEPHTLLEGYHRFVGQALMAFDGGAEEPAEDRCPECGELASEGDGEGCRCQTDDDGCPDDRCPECGKVDDDMPF